MTKFHVIATFIAAVITFNCANAANLRQHDTSRRLVIMEATENASSNFIFDKEDASNSEEASIDGSNTVETNTDVEGSEDRSDSLLVVEVEANVDGVTPLEGLNAREPADEDATAEVDTDNDNSVQDVDSPYQPGTVQAAPIDESTWANREFNKSSLTWLS